MPSQPPHCRLAHWSDTRAMAEIAALAFDQNDLCGRYMHPHRHRFPADYITFWRREIRSRFFEPGVWFLVTTVSKEEEGEGEGKEEGRVVVGAAKWKRMGEGRRTDSSWINAILHPTLLLLTSLSNLLFPIRSADPSVATHLSDATPFFSHHWSGPRAETYFLDMLCVAPRFQRQGHGRALVQWGKDRARQEGVCASLTAAEGKEGFYKEMGFGEVGRANVGPLAGVEGGAVMFCDEP